MAAASRVFAIPELLEKILLYLPERDLLLTQRVNKAFRNVADSSLHLQRKLFLRADVDSEDGPVPNLKWNPLIDIFGLEKGSQDAISADRTVMYRNFWGRWRRVHIESTMSLNDFIAEYSVLLDFKALKNANYPFASWKRMFITQPALRKMTCYIPAWPRNEYLYLLPTWMPYEAKDSTGVKMGPLGKMVWNFLKNNEFGTGVEVHIVSDLTRQGYGEWR